LKRRVFRARPDDISKFGKFMYGDLVYDRGVPCIKAPREMLFTTCVRGTEGEYIGRVDRNGVAIYEHDIVLVHHPRAGSKGDTVKCTVRRKSNGLWYGHRKGVSPDVDLWNCKWLEVMSHE